MNIEEIEYLKENLKNWKDTRPSLSNTDIVEEVDKDYKAIETLLTAYEKEKEKNKLLEENYSSAHEDINWFCENYIHKNKLKEIVDECIPKKENIITKELEYTPNANANSYLTQEILSLLKEE